MSEGFNSLLPFGVNFPARLSVAFITPIFHKNSVRPASSIVAALIKMNLVQELEEGERNLFQFSSCMNFKVSCCKSVKEKKGGEKNKVLSSKDAAFQNDA